MNALLEKFLKKVNKNLLELFEVEPVPTVGFGMGDIAMRDFLETHKLGPYA